MSIVNQKTTTTTTTTTTRIFDEKKEQKNEAGARAIQNHRCVDFIDDRLSLDKSNENIRMVCKLAKLCYMEPITVQVTVNYWMTHYTDYFIQEKDWFNQMIANLLYEVPVLRKTAIPMTIVPNKRLVRSNTMVCFAGTDKMYIPLQEYLDHCRLDLALNINAAYLKLPFLLSVLSETERRSFRMRNTDTLEGDICLSAFNYDNIMGYFYEPSFLIITAYVFHLIALTKTTEGCATSDFLPRHVHSLSAIQFDNIEWHRVSVNNNSNDSASLERLQYDLQRLYDILYTTDLNKALCDIDQLWHEKATAMVKMAKERKRVIHSRFLTDLF